MADDVSDPKRAAPAPMALGNATPSYPMRDADARTVQVRWARPALIFVAYLASVLVGVTAIPVITLINGALGLGPKGLFWFYVYALALGFGYLLAFVLVTLPLMLWIAASEVFRIRAWWAHILVCGASAYAGWYTLTGSRITTAFDYIGADMAAGGAVGGLVYWGIAGRSAGNWTINSSAQTAA